MAMPVMRSGRPWYGCLDLVAAVWGRIIVLGLTIPFLTAQIGSTVSCHIADSDGSPREPKGRDGCTKLQRLCCDAATVAGAPEQQ
jgi:hypothetical protein